MESILDLPESSRYMADEPAMFNMLAEKVMHQAINPAYLAYCPTMDLIALATIDEQVQVYRLNGQRVFGVTNKQSESKIRGLKWKPNGQLLAVAFDNGSVSLVSAHTGKVVHQTQRSTSPKPEICCLGWEMNLTAVEAVVRGLKKLGQEVTLDDILDHRSQTMARNAPLDLPTDLAFLDIEGALPRLSTLPAGGKDDEIFSTRSSMDAIFHPSKGHSNDSADILLVAFEDGTFHLCIYDIFDIGVFNLRKGSQKLEGGKAISHRAHPYSSTHSLLVSVPSKSLWQIYYVPLDLRLISTTGRYLSLLASKSTQLQNILRYIQQIQKHIYNEFKAAQDLPRKFMRNIEETLQEKTYCSWVHAAYHLVVTGNCFPPVKEWLVDELGERGHKRWEKATTAGYENIRRLTHENLLPALERFGVFASRLRGLSKFQESTDTFGLSRHELDDVLDTVNCLQLLSHNVLISASSELRQFVAFSAWLRQEIDIQATDPTSASAEETAEKDSMLDHTEILDYIQGAMLQSRLVELFNIQSSDDKRPQQDLASEGRLIYQAYKKEVKAYSQGKLPEKKLPGLDSLTARLDTQCSVLFNRIAETQRRQVRVGSPTLLQEGCSKHVDMRMVVELDSVNTSTTYVLTTSTSARHSVILYKVTLKVKSGISATTAVESSRIQLPSETIKDVGFVDDESLMVALLGISSSRLLVIPYRNLPYHPHKLRDRPSLDSNASGTDFQPGLDFSNGQDIGRYVRQSFPSGSTWTPERLEINGRKGRRVLYALAEDNIHYRIYDLDSNSVDEAAGAGLDMEEAEGDEGNDVIS